jgi:hypothetical protein
MNRIKVVYDAELGINGRDKIKMDLKLNML